MSDDQNPKDEQEITYEETPDLEAGDDLAGDEAVGERTIKKLRERLAAAEEEKAKNLNGWQRAQADLANAVRRHDEERRRFLALGEENVLAEVIPTLDAFDMAMGNRDAWEKADENWRRGIEMIRAQLAATLAKFGVTPIDPVGEKFDPARHQAVASARAESAEADDTVVAVAQKGYARGDVIIRPAMVTVAHLEG
jgi:molecular chaperone GrpE